MYVCEHRPEAGENEGGKDDIKIKYIKFISNNTQLTS